MTLKKIRERGGFKCLDLVLFFIVFPIMIISFPNVLSATDYPTKPIQMIVPFPPGGGSDTVARILNEKLSALLGQPVVIVNKSGGGGIIGTYAALAAPPDGYTNIIFGPTHLMAHLLTKGVTFNFLKDFTMVNLTVTSPTLVVVKKEASWLILEELIAEAKKNPGKLNCSTSGYGSTAHFAGELFKMRTGTDITHIPMDGSSPALMAILGGHTSMGFQSLGETKKYLEAGSLRALAVMARRRLRELPDVPTTIEKEFPDMISGAWQGFSVRSETPRVIIEKLEKVFREALNEKEIIEKFEKTGWVAENLGLKEAAEFLAKDHQTKSEVARTAKIVPK